jgi:site-specific DNA recombinase
MNAILYARFSPRPVRTSRATGKQFKPSDADSVEKQLERCEAWCKAKGYTVIGREFDKQASGATDDRPGLQRALAGARASRGILVVYTLDRISRDFVDTGVILRDLLRRRVAVASVFDNLDLTTRDGRFLANIKASIAEYQRELIADRTSVAMRQYQRQGFLMGSICPTGWAQQGSPGRMEPNADEQRGVDRARELRQEGMGYRRIADALTAEGYRYRGGLWNYQTIRRSLAR